MCTYSQGWISPLEKSEPTGCKDKVADDTVAEQPDGINDDQPKTAGW